MRDPPFHKGGRRELAAMSDEGCREADGRRIHAAASRAASAPTKATNATKAVAAPRIMALSSRVARGRVGLSIIEPALYALGCDVLALPTIQLASRPGLGRMAGRPTPPDDLAAMLDALDADGAFGNLDAVLTGYAPTRGHVDVMVDAVTRARRASPGVRIVCDPVLGDGTRLYLEPDAAAALRDRLAPLADLLTPNAFEMGWLAGRPDMMEDVGGLARAARAHPAGMVAVTSAPPLLRGHLGVLLIGEGTSLMAEAHAAPGHPRGTGDLFGALLTAHLARGLSPEKALAQAVGGVHGITLRSAKAGADHLLVVEEAGEMLRPIQPVSLRRMG